MPDTLRVTTPDGVLELPVRPGETLAQALYLSGRLESPALCAGLGRCGQCRVRWRGQSPEAPEPLEVERAVFTPTQLDNGWRLACRRPAEPGLDLALPARESRRLGHVGAADGGEDAVLAVDLGTTSLHWRAWAGDRSLGRGFEPNPQLGAGAEVMSRLAYATDPQGRARLRGLVLDRLRAVRDSLDRPLAGLCVAGNPAMVYILLDLDVTGIARAPYGLDFAGGERVALADDLPPAYVPPLLAPFVGGDVSAGLAWLCRGREPEYPFVLADLGTNGECVLALSKTEFLAASVALGPALEGVGLTHGCLAVPGAVTGFVPGPRGLEPRVLDRGELQGITGTGYLSLCNTLRRLGALDSMGRFPDPADPGLTPLARRVVETVTRTRTGEKRLPLPGKLALYPVDVEEVLKVKAAFNLALSALLDAAGLSASRLAAVHLAGALGEHVSPEDLEGLGFLPPGLGNRVRRAGNTSLAGAGLLLRDPATREWVRTAAGRVRTLDLAGADDFGPRFMRRMVFEHVH
jgi:uncharacterized 2Fe-2S/4Fe-4S cluster protein (DUF4445 family)